MLFWNNGIKAVVVDGTSIADIGLQPEYTTIPVHRYIQKQLTGLYVDLFC